MKHEERIKLVNDYAKRLLSKHGDDLIYFGVGGSTYWKKEREDSDIDGFIVTSSKKYWPSSNWPDYIFKDIAISIGYYTLEELDNIIKEPKYRWPYRVYRTMHNLPIYQKYDLVSRYKKIISEIDTQKFIDAATDELIVAMSCIGKINYNAVNSSLGALRSSIMILQEFTDMVVALLNKAMLGSGFSIENIEFIAKYQKIPKGYVELSKTMWGSNNIEELHSASNQLLENTISFAEENGVCIPKYESVTDLPV
ncbi:MAG TPA: hypothetical protein VL944_03200 [Candidatus Acidoferrum sp.]|nr:hypothetical protein [Candidatus Acidoferrum sp.]